MKNTMGGWRDKIRRELKELIPVTVFFLVSFQVLALTKALMLGAYGIRVQTFLGALVAALVVAKVVVIADHLPFVNRFPDKPLIYNVVWKTMIYFVASVAVRYVEHLIHFWRQTDGFAAANRRLLDEIVWPHFWAVQLWLLILLFLYCSMRELVRALGAERIAQVFLRTPARDVHVGITRRETADVGVL
jgi:hypothetical protein